MRELLAAVRHLQKGPLKKTIQDRISEFKKTGKKSSAAIFCELCFCLLTANFNAQRAIEIQEKIGKGFQNLPERKLAKKLKALGHRFPNARAQFIVKARKHKEIIARLLKSCPNDSMLRHYLAAHIKGLDYKEASHFLRNIGRSGCAIIDFHIIDILVKYKIIKNRANLSRKRYLEIERTLLKLAEKLNLSLAELDLYLWFLDTGKVLK